MAATPISPLAPATKTFLIMLINFLENKTVMFVQPKHSHSIPTTFVLDAYRLAVGNGEFNRRGVVEVVEQEESWLFQTVIADLSDRPWLHLHLKLLREPMAQHHSVNGLPSLITAVGLHPHAAFTRHYFQSTTACSERAKSEELPPAVFRERIGMMPRRRLQTRNKDA
jgi:hypothetical protein